MDAQLCASLKMVGIVVVVHKIHKMSAMKIVVDMILANSLVMMVMRNQEMDVLIIVHSKQDTNVQVVQVLHMMFAQIFVEIT